MKQQKQEDEMFRIWEEVYKKNKDEASYDLEREMIKAGQKSTLEQVKKLINDVDIELFFTDIKDKKGEKYELSNEFMEIIRIWWDGKSENIKQKLEEIGK